MSIKNRVEKLESLEDYRRRRRGSLPVETRTDAELEAIVADALGIDESEITDELLETVARS